MVSLEKILKQLRKERKGVIKELEKVEAAVIAIEKLVGKAVRDGASRGEKALGSTRRKLSAAGRKRIAAAQKARWAKLKQQVAKKIG